jgi:hypothetical protein
MIIPSFVTKKKLITSKLANHYFWLKIGYFASVCLDSYFTQKLPNISKLKCDWFKVIIKLF